MDLNVIPECYVDTNLLETIVPPKRRGNQMGYNHQKGCGTVASRMQKKFDDEFALGIIDKDKHEIDYLKEFTEVITTESLILHKHKTKHHYIIQIYPAVEKFILLNMSLLGLSPKDFDLPEDFDLFKKESKKEQSKTDVRFQNLFKRLKKEGTPDILKLAAWVEYIKVENYKVDINKLKGL